jgi:S1-C subfamily serine protease
MSTRIGHKMNRIVWIMTTLVIAPLTGCATYMYGGTSYLSAVEARRAAEADVSIGISGVMPTDQRIAGSVEVVIPTREVIRERGITNPQATDEAGRDYITDVLEIGFIAIFDVVKRGAVFDQTTLARSSDPETVTTGETDYILWLLGLSPTQWQWYLSSKTSSEKVPVNFDMALQGAARNNSFNQAIIAAAKQLGPATTEKNQPERSGDSESSSRYGTGFFINDGGFAISNAHVVEGCSEVTASQAGGTSLSVTVIASDSRNDLTLLKVAERPAAHGKFRSAPAVRQGEQVVIYGYPLAGALASTGNLSSGIVTALAGLADDTTTLQISAPVQPGNSGGPVIDESGLIVGVVQSKLDVIRVAVATGDIAQNVNFAIPDLGDKIKAFTFMLRCDAR